MAKHKVTSVDEYLAAAPPEAQEKLTELRALLRSVAPAAQEVLKWNTPVYEEGRILFAYSAFKKHLNFMPTRRTLDHFKNELTGYVTGRDSVQFPYDQPLPAELILKLARHRVWDVRENGSLWMG